MTSQFSISSSFKTDNNNDINFIYKDQLCGDKLVFRVQGQNGEFKDK